MMLSLVIFLPLIAGVMLCLYPRDNKAIAVIISILHLILSLSLWMNFDLTLEWNYLINIPLAASWGIYYCVALDGISLFLVILSSFITLIGIISIGDVERRNHLIISVLILETASIGVFSTLNMIVFYVFWEFSLVPMLYIIGVFGGERRVYASVKFFLYTFCASLFMLFGIIVFSVIYYKLHGQLSFNLFDWYEFSLSASLQRTLFLLFIVGIAVKIPMFPLHTWLPYAHGQAPTVGSVILAAVLLKMGSYAFLRLAVSLFPDAVFSFMYPIALVCLVMIIYAAALAFAQKDMKQVIAYSSISHMGVVVLGSLSFNVVGIGGSVFFMLSHGIISGALFLIVGMIYERAHTKEISDFSAVSKFMPRFTLITALMMMASVGLPLTMGFVGEFLSLLGFFKVDKVITLIAGSSIIFGAVYTLNLFRNVFLGPLKYETESKLSPLYSSLKDVNVRELCALLPLCFIVLWLGIYPSPVLKFIEQGANNLMHLVDKRSSDNRLKEMIK